jgi:hypothetical protein
MGKSLPFISLLGLLCPCGGMSELLAPWEVTLMGRFLSAGEFRLPVNLSVAPGWLELPALWVDLPELPTPY